MMPSIVSMIVAPLLASGAAADTRMIATAPLGCPSAIERTLPHLRTADVSLARGNTRQANEKLDLALRSLGNSYAQ